MNSPAPDAGPISIGPLWWRWIALLLLAETLRRLSGLWTNSPSESFWACLPVVIVAAASLKVIPPPQLNAESRAGRIAILVILMTVPTLFEVLSV